MISYAKARFIRTSPRKARLVIDLIRGKTVEDAGSILDNVNKRASRYIKKVLDAAFANANQQRQNKILSRDLVVASAKIDGGPTLYRYRAATMGRATPIRHRTAHIYIELDAASGDNAPQDEKQISKEK